MAEHARPLDPQGLRGVRKNDFDALAQRADQLRALAPFAPRVPFAPSPRERTLRQYLAAFGVESPPRIDGERPGAEVTLATALERLATEKPRASAVHVWAPAPSTSEAIAHAVGALRARRLAVRWSLPPFEAGVGADRSRRSPVAEVVDEAVRLRARATRARAEAFLHKLGVRVVSDEAAGPLRSAGRANRDGPREGAR